MKTLTALTAIVSVAGLCWGADLIRFKDGIELGGPHTEVLSCDAEHVRVKVQYGTVTLNADRIALIKIDFEGRKESLKDNGEDTPKNLFDLGVLCDQNQMLEEAFEAYKLALRKENVTEEMLRRLAEIFEQRRKFHEAKEAYDRLLLTNPADKSLQKKVAFCREMAAETPRPPEETVDAGDDGKPEKDPGATVEVHNEEPVEPKPDNEKPDVPREDEPQLVAPKELEGLEANQWWRVEQWGNSGTCEIVAEGDNKLLNVAWTAKDKDKVAVRLNVDMDLRDKAKLTFDVYNGATSPAGVGVAFNTLPGYQFFESLAFNSGVKKWVPIKIDLASKKFKCAATNWRYMAEIANRDNVKDVFILIYNRDAKGALFIDNIRFHGADEGK